MRGDDVDARRGEVVEADRQTDSNWDMEFHTGRRRAGEKEGRKVVVYLRTLQSQKRSHNSSRDSRW